METFSNAVLIGVQTGFHKTYTESLKKVLIPAYEKSSEEMFKQIQEVFLQGTKSCKYKKKKQRNSLSYFFTYIYVSNKIIYFRCKAI